MQGIFEIKGITFGSGRPVICVPVMEKKKEDIIAKIHHLTEQGAAMIEWRVDGF